MSASAEKRGNTHWAQCPDCKRWFHVSLSMLTKAGVRLHCPHCARQFLREEAARIVRAS